MVMIILEGFLQNKITLIHFQKINFKNHGLGKITQNLMEPSGSYVGF